jgi:hypothetical protein
MVDGLQELLIGLVYPTTVWVEPHENGGQRLRQVASPEMCSQLAAAPAVWSHLGELIHCYRMDTYGGTDVIITTKERDIELVPRVDETVCLIFENGDSVTSGASVGSFVNGNQPVGSCGRAILSIIMPGTLPSEQHHTDALLMLRHAVL